jgi:hypothetical protein
MDYALFVLAAKLPEELEHRQKRTPEEVLTSPSRKKQHWWITRGD